LTVYTLDPAVAAGAEDRGGHRALVGLDLATHGSGLRLAVGGSWGQARIDSALLGRFNAYNLLAALGALLAAGIPLAAAAAALGQCATVPGRVEAFRGPRAQPLVVVDYAHTPQALTQALLALRPHTSGRLWCVFGCGGDRDTGKRPLMGAAAAELADGVVVTDDNPRSETPSAITDAILAGIPAAVRTQIRVEHDRARAIEAAVRDAGSDDVVLVAGKGHETYQIYGSERRMFSDRAWVAKLVGVEERP
jgi:UDP-N-acetylmuramoyl-L-alanyl-D-glutamate--2,6-diaminopimelate ligase